jgi:hypothetical protein
MWPPPPQVEPWSGLITFLRWTTKALPVGIAFVVGAATLAFVATLFYEVFFVQSIVIKSISVPKELEEDGDASDIAATHLRDALQKYVNLAHIRDDDDVSVPQLSLDDDFPQVVLPTVGLSLKSWAAQISDFLRLDRRHIISGDITCDAYQTTQKGQERECGVAVWRTLGATDSRATQSTRFRLRLRENSLIIFDHAIDTDQTPLEKLFDMAVPFIFGAAMPYFKAAHEFNSDREAGIATARRIINERLPTDQNVIWAHNLLGLFHLNNSDLDHLGHAETQFNWVIQHAPHFAPAHINLGKVYLKKANSFGLRRSGGRCLTRRSTNFAPRSARIAITPPRTSNWGTHLNNAIREKIEKRLYVNTGRASRIFTTRS